MARRVKGAASISRLLKRLPDDVRGEIIVEFNVVGPRIAAKMQGRAPYRTGATRTGIKWKVLPKSLKLQVGLLGSPGERNRLFYARIQDLGRKAGGRGITRGSAKYSGGVGAMVGKRFVTGEMKDLRSEISRDLGAIYDRAITKAANGSGND